MTGNQKTSEGVIYINPEMMILLKSKQSVSNSIYVFPNGVGDRYDNNLYRNYKAALKWI